MKEREGGALVMIAARVGEAELYFDFHSRNARGLTGERGGNVKR